MQLNDICSELLKTINCGLECTNTPNASCCEGIPNG